MNQVQQAILDAVLKASPRPQAILDIGCGNASFTQVMASVLPGTRVTGLDLAYPKRAVPAGIKFVMGCVEVLPFGAESFDVLTASKSLHHWDDKDKGLAEAYRVLKKGGWLVIGDPLIQGWLENRFAKWLVPLLDSGSISVYGELVAALKGAGFESIDITMIPHSLKSLFLIVARKP